MGLLSSAGAEEDALDDPELELFLLESRLRSRRRLQQRVFATFLAPVILAVIFLVALFAWTGLRL